MGSLDKSTFGKLFETMLFIRRFEEKIVELYPEQEMRCPTHLYIGQEAIATGVCANLTKEDIVFSGHRSHGHYLAKGGDPKKMLAEIYGKETGCCHGKGGSMHLIDLDVNFKGALPIVAGSVPIAAGTALASKIKKEKRISVAFFGDAAVEQGVMHEVMNFASLHNLPLLLVCENNDYATLTRLKDRQPKRKITKLADSHNILSLQSDGNDVGEVYETSRKAIDHIRKGNGPAFIEFETYRILEHCGPLDDHEQGFRPKEEREKWLKKCPIKLAEKKISKEEVEKMEKETEKELQEIVSFAKNSKFPDKKTLKEDVYA